jgi:hypothetical protein
MLTTNIPFRIGFFLPNLALINADVARCDSGFATNRQLTSPNSPDTRVSRFLGSGRITGNPHLAPHWLIGRVTEGLPTTHPKHELILLDEHIALKSSTETKATLMFVDDHARLNHATTGLELDMATLCAGLIRPRSARLVRNSANIQHAPIALRLYTAAPHVL